MSEIILTGRELESNNVTDRMVGIYDEAAQREFLEVKANLNAWLDRRFGELGMDTDGHHKLRLSLNPYNRDYDLGIQSAGLGITRDDEPLRLARAFKDSTIGVIADGLLDEPLIWDAVGFPVGPGKIERLYQLSPNLKLTSRSEDRVKLGRLAVLRGILDVVGPNFATTILQRKRTKADRGKRGRMPNRGVYACDYLESNK